MQQPMFFVGHTTESAKSTQQRQAERASLFDVRIPVVCLVLQCFAVEDSIKRHSIHNDVLFEFYKPIEQ